MECFASDATPSGSDDPAADQIETLSPAKIEKKLPEWNPAHYYEYAARLWSEGKRDDAVFWFYEGQLRYRILLVATPDPDPSGAPALFGALQEQVGRPIILYAMGDIKKLIGQIDAVLAWDEAHDNGTTSKKKYADTYLSEREKFKKYRDYLRDHLAELKEQREQAGIGEYGVKNGVYREEQNPKMDKEWPALLKATLPEQVAGEYKEDFKAGLTTVFFSDGPGRRPWIDRVSFVVSAKGSLLVIGKKGDVEVVRRTVEVSRAEGGLMFVEKRKTESAEAGPSTEVETCILRKNSAGDLVIERRSVTGGRQPGKAFPYRVSFTFWSRAKVLESGAPAAPKTP